MISCAALLAAFFGGVSIESVDRSVVYDISQTKVDEMTWSQRGAARTCARAYGIRYRIVK